jgi:hypothetical protein
MDKRPEKTFLRRRYKNEKSMCEKYSTSLTIREIQIKATMKHHLTSEWLVSKKTRNNKC